MYESDELATAANISPTNEAINYSVMELSGRKMIICDKPSALVLCMGVRNFVSLH